MCQHYPFDSYTFSSCPSPGEWGGSTLTHLSSALDSQDPRQGQHSEPRFACSARETTTDAAGFGFVRSLFSQMELLVNNGPFRGKDSNSWLHGMH